MKKQQPPLASPVWSTWCSSQKKETFVKKSNINKTTAEALWALIALKHRYWSWWWYQLGVCVLLQGIGTVRILRARAFDHSLTRAKTQSNRSIWLFKETLLNFCFWMLALLFGHQIAANCQHRHWADLLNEIRTLSVCISWFRIPPFINFILIANKEEKNTHFWLFDLWWPLWRAQIINRQKFLLFFWFWIDMSRRNSNPFRLISIEFPTHALRVQQIPIVESSFFCVLLSDRKWNIIDARRLRVQRRNKSHSFYFLLCCTQRVVGWLFVFWTQENELHFGRRYTLMVDSFQIDSIESRQSFSKKKMCVLRVLQRKAIDVCVFAFPASPGRSSSPWFSFGAKCGAFSIVIWFIFAFVDSVCTNQMSQKGIFLSDWGKNRTLLCFFSFYSLVS